MVVPGAVLEDEPEVVVVLAPGRLGPVGTKVVVVEDSVPLDPAVVEVVDEEVDGVVGAWR